LPILRFLKIESPRPLGTDGASWARMVEAFREAVDRFIDWQGYVRNRELAAHLGLSKQRVTVLLRQLVDRGELCRQGAGPSARYVPATRKPWQAGRVMGPRTVWRVLAEAFPEFAYIALGAAGQTRFRTREEARRVLQDAGRLFLVIDFAGVAFASRAFLAELMGVYEQRITLIEPVNATPEIFLEVTALRAEARRRFPRPPRSVPSTPAPVPLSVDAGISEDDVDWAEHIAALQAPPPGEDAV
jgi:hypothetical protein